MAVTKPFFVVPLDLGTIATGNEVAGHDADNLKRFKDVGLTWKTSGASSVWIRGQFASAQRINFCSMLKGNAIAATDYRLRLGTSQAQVDGGSAPYDSGTLDFISPSITRTDGLYKSHLEIGTVQTGVTWWRIDITSHTGDFELPFLVLGEKITPGRFYNHDFARGVQDLGNLNFNPWAVPEEEDGLVLRTIQFMLAWQTKAEIETSFLPMIEQLGTRGMVYLCFDPTANAYRDANSYFGHFEKPPIATGMRKPETYAQEFQIRSLV